MNIQWYPGHMTKTKRMIAENISLVDIVIELLDARIPLSSKNPSIDELAKNKFRIVLMNKSDLADPKVTEQWCNYFNSLGHKVILTDSVSGKGINEITEASKALMKEKVERLRARGRIFVPVRAMIVGIPNVGKSTLINKYVGRATTKTGDKPGVTKGKQWVKVKKDFELLDTPGILWPKFDDETVGLNLAFTGAINDQIMDRYTLSVKLIERLLEIKPQSLEERYKINIDNSMNSNEILEKIGEARGFRMKGGSIDLERTSNILLDEFRGLKLGRISLEHPPYINVSSME